MLISDEIHQISKIFNNLIN